MKRKASSLKFRLYQPEMGHPDWHELNKEANLLIEEIKDDITLDSELTFLDRMEDLNRRRKSYITTLANFYENRRRLKNNNHCLRPLYWIWVMTNSCNLRCKYCDDHAGRSWFEKSNRHTLDTEEGMKLLRFMRTGCSAIYFCGGEPTLREDLPDFIEEAAKLGYYPMALNTNLVNLHKKLKDPKWKDVLRKLDIVVVSVDALNPDTLNDLFQRRQGMTVLTNVLMLRELQKHVKFMLIVNSVVTPETIKEARVVMDWCNDLDIFFAAVPANYKEGPDMHMINNSEYRNFVRTLLERKKRGYKIIGSSRLLDKFLYAKPYTCLTTIKPHVSSDGSLPWPCRASVNIPPVYLNTFDYKNVDELYEEAAKFVNPTNFHGHAQNQCGGYCAWYQNYTTEAYRETLLRPLNFVSEARELTSNL